MDLEMNKEDIIKASKQLIHIKNKYPEFYKMHCMVLEMSKYINTMKIEEVENPKKKTTLQKIFSNLFGAKK